MLFFTHCALNRLETQPSIEDKFGQQITALENPQNFRSQKVTHRVLIITVQAAADLEVNRHLDLNEVVVQQ